MKDFVKKLKSGNKINKKKEKKYKICRIFYICRKKKINLFLPILVVIYLAFYILDSIWTRVEGRH